MLSNLRAAVTTLILGVLWTQEAFAVCIGSGCEPAPHAPEFDGPAGVAAIALLVSLGAILYNKAKK
jgi:hypothetical protein